MAAKARAAGVLPISAAATKKDKPANSHAKSSPRTPAPKLRLIVRRLAPGLTESEFWDALGAEWKVGAGKIDWAAFKDGKISKDLSKPSVPARAYLKVKDQSLLDALSDKVKQSSFQDAKNTTRDPCLIGPPSLEFAPFNKIISGRAKNDNRQGTIDQDQEFIDYLQSLTEPTNRSGANGADTEASTEKITTTPLVEYLKEKKANKAKEAAEKKSAKARQQDTKDAKQPKTEKVIVKSAPSSPEKTKLAKASQEAVKAINKSVAQLQAKPVTTPATTKSEAKAQSKEAAATAAAPKRERQNISAAARIQRDLGLAPKAPRAARTACAATAATPATTGAKTDTKASEKPTATAAEAKKNPSAKQAAPPTAPATTTPPTGPRATRNNNVPAAATPAAPPVASKAAAQPRAKAVPQPSPGAKSAFLKHANPSQGVTEELLRAAFSTFGNVARCEIDKKKGLGYVDFEDTEGLKKAMAASPVKVGDKGGQVVVMENRNMPKTPKTSAQKAPATNAAVSTTSAAKANTPVASPKPVSPIPAATTTTPAADAATATANPTPGNTQTKDRSDPAKTDTPAPPTAPRNNNKGAAGAGRGGRASNADRGRGAGGGAGGGRGGGRNRGGGRARGGANAAAAGESTAPTATPKPEAAVSGATKAGDDATK